MFGLKKRGPTKEFTHADDCRIVKADPDVRIEWSEMERGYWEATCVCGKEYYREPAAPRVRLDPLDPKTSRHAGQCELVNATDPAVLRLALRVKESDGYWWVECVACEHGWQVPYYAERVMS
jgi:hypothetical protein